MDGIKPFTPFKKIGTSITPKVNGDALDETIIGSTTPAAGTFTSLTSTGGRWTAKFDAGAADYNPSILTSDYRITVDTTAAARNVIISSEDVASGSITSVREFIIFDIAGNAGINNISVSLENGGNINGVPIYVINANYNSIILIIDGTNGFVN